MNQKIDISISKTNDIFIIIAIVSFMVLYCWYQKYYATTEKFGGTCSDNYNIINENSKVKKIVQECCDGSKDVGFYDPYDNLKSAMEELPDSVDNIKSINIQTLYDITTISNKINDFYNIISESNELTLEQKKEIMDFSINDSKEMELKFKKYVCLSCCDKQDYNKDRNTRACKTICNSKYT